MSLTREQQKKLSQFPPVLQELLQAEFAAGNSIVEIGHGFPAPPVGAYCKLSGKISSRPRASGGGLEFFERNGSSYSGEFTDAKRFFFVLEPPEPPPKEPDMDAIRNALEEKVAASDALRRLALRETLSSESRAPSNNGGDSNRALSAAATQQREGKKDLKLSRGPKLSPHSVLQSSTTTGASWLLHFRDRRPPQEIQFQLERALMILMPPCIDDGKLVFCGLVKITGASYTFRVSFEAAVRDFNYYSFRVEASWAEMAATHYEYYSTSSASWFELWTRDFQRATLPVDAENQPGRYQEICATALSAEAHLDSVAAIQQAISAALKNGGYFVTAHKEGGTNISWRNGRFIRCDYGESDERQEFADEAEFLVFLRRFYDWETSKNIYPGKAPDFDAWKLILRLLRTS